MKNYVIGMANIKRHESRWRIKERRKAKAKEREAEKENDRMNREERRCCESSAQTLCPPGC